MFVQNPPVIRDHAQRHIGIVSGLKLDMDDKILVTCHFCKEIGTMFGRGKRGRERFEIQSPVKDQRGEIS